MAECIVDTFGIVQDFADLHGDMSTPLYQAIMDVMVSRQREEIVRCRDCRYASAGEAVISGNWQMGNCHNPRFRMSLHAANVRADGFCAWGERGEDE